jgi:GR25 family glycosyltransferase involved in LPS biosynthesis
MSVLSGYIDHVFYINLDRRNDRRIHIEAEMDKIGISPYERFTAVERPVGQGIVGCGYSHLAVLKLAKERKYENVLIFEDDFQFIVSPAELRQNIRDFYEGALGDDYDVCMLSYNLRESDECPQTPFVRRVRYAQTASGYIVHSRYYDTLIQLYEWAIPLLEQTGQHWVYANDVVWKELQTRDKWYCFSQRIGRQLDGFSDNAGRFIQYDC